MEFAKIKLSSGREVIIDENVVRILNKYVRTEITLETLAKELGLSNWEEAYELVKQAPAFIMWTPLPILKRILS
jgi:hypothetical protein